jgi:hypothetical protein
MMPSTRQALPFKQELAEFWRYIRCPRLLRRLPGRRLRSSLLRADWLPPVRSRRILAWASLLWGVNFLVLGPLAVAAAGAGEVSHRIDLHNIPWLTAILWAPVVEEMLFRYGLRRPTQALWLVPALALAIYWGARTWTLVLLLAVVGLACWYTRQGDAVPWRFAWRRAYVRHFGLVFHLSALAFATVHLSNYQLGMAAYWLLPFLVLPQWVTGLVLGWIRVQRGIGAAIALHIIFNTGPMLLVWVLIHWFTDKVI